MDDVTRNYRKRQLERIQYLNGEYSPSLKFWGCTVGSSLTSPLSMETTTINITRDELEAIKAILTGAKA